MRTIVVPVVDSPAGQRALDLAKADAATTGARLVLVGAATISGRVVKNIEAVQRYLAELEKELVDQGFDCVTEWAVGESLSDVTLRAAEEHDADLITMGLRRRSQVGKALLGSYEQEVLLGAPCPVLSVAGRLGEEFGRD
ncbi:MAG TPA: universal stress protein [Acidimicrobiia bacterium]|jgi:nucleotide-binding universal stress UspA family protein